MKIVKSAFGLECATLSYLSLPYLFFFMGTLQFWFGIPATLIVLFAIWKDLPHIPAINNTPKLQTDWRHWVNPGMTFLIVLVWVGLSGSGGYGFQNGDYLKHNAVLHDLIVNSWPVRYAPSPTHPGHSSILVYYVAYYLPAAVAGKIWGWVGANRFLFLWTLLGVWLAVRWFQELTDRRSFWMALIFVLAGGLDFLGNYALTSRFFQIGEHAEWWAAFAQYSSNSAALYWVPHQTIAAWLLTGLLLYRWRHRPLATGSIFLLALGCLWAPFVCIGLAPFVLALAIRKKWRGLNSFQDLIAAPVIVLVVFFYIHATDYSIPHMWAWQMFPWASHWRNYCWFYVLEFMVYVIFLTRERLTRDDLDPWIWRVTLAVLIVLPLYRAGLMSDLTMRASLPSLFILWIFVGGMLARGWSSFRTDLRYKLLFITFSIGSLTGFSEIARALIYPYGGEPPSERSVVTVPHLRDWEAPQYQGSEDSFFARTLAKPSSLGGQPNAG